MPDDWRVSALCAQTDPEAFFPEPTQVPRAALRVCARCEVRADCLQDAIDTDEQHGVRGGYSASQRRQMAAARRRTAQHTDTSAA